MIVYNIVSGQMSRISIVPVYNILHYSKELAPLIAQYQYRTTLNYIRWQVPKDSKYMLMWHNNKLVGILRYHNIPDAEYMTHYNIDPSHAGDIIVVNVLVDKDHRGRGFAKQMMRHLIENNKGKNFTLFVLRSNEAAVSVYRSVGFLEQKFKTVHKKDGTIEDVVQMRRIGSI